MSTHYARCKYDDATGSYIPLEVRPTTDKLKKDDPLYQEGFQAGAASRDAEIERWAYAVQQVRKALCGDIHNTDDLLDLISGLHSERDHLRARVALMRS